MTREQSKNVIRIISACKQKGEQNLACENSIIFCLLPLAFCCNSLLSHRLSNIMRDTSLLTSLTSRSKRRATHRTLRIYITSRTSLRSRHVSQCKRHTFTLHPTRSILLLYTNFLLLTSHSAISRAFFRHFVDFFRTSVSANSSQCKSFRNLALHNFFWNTYRLILFLS
jgi:hypothetical protein